MRLCQENAKHHTSQINRFSPKNQKELTNRRGINEEAITSTWYVARETTTEACRSASSNEASTEAHTMATSGFVMPATALSARVARARHHHTPRTVTSARSVLGFTAAVDVDRAGVRRPRGGRLRGGAGAGTRAEVRSEGDDVTTVAKSAAVGISRRKLALVFTCTLNPKP